MLGFKLLKKFRDKEGTSKHHTSYETSNKASPLMEKMKKKIIIIIIIIIIILK